MSRLNFGANVKMIIFIQYRKVKQKMNIDKFMAKHPIESINIQQLFDVTLFYKEAEDVKYLLQHYKKHIHISDDVLYNTSVEIFKVITESFKIGKITIDKTVGNLIKSQFIPIIIKNYTGKLTNDMYKRFINIALESNDKGTIKYLLSLKSDLEIKELVNKYMYVLLLCGAGDSEQLGEYLHIVIEIADECFQTAYLCENLENVRFLLDMEINIQNCFLKEKILCDQRLWQRYRNGQIRLDGSRHYWCENCY